MHGGAGPGRTIVVREAKGLEGVICIFSDLMKIDGFEKGVYLHKYTSKGLDPHFLH